MADKKNTPPQDAPTLPGAQPTGSGASPGSAQGAAEGVGQETLGEELKRKAAGIQVAPGVNDGTKATPEDAELGQTEEDAELAAAAEEPMVVYVGEFSKREITAQQWAEAGVRDMPTVVWERRTGSKVPLDVFTPQALQVLRQDGNFQVQE